jgi:transposase
MDTAVLCGALQHKTLPKVATEMALCVLTYNLTRLLNIVGVEKIREAISA